MQPGEALSAASQLAMALAGFAGVVVAFRSGALHEWQAIDKLRLRLLLTNSVVPLGSCLLAMLLLSINPPPPWIWRGCSGVAVAFVLPFGVSIMKSMRAIPPAELSMTGTTRFIFYGVGIVGTAATLLQIYNLAVLDVFWAFFTTIVVHLITGVLQFVRLILLPPRGTN